MASEAASAVASEVQYDLKIKLYDLNNLCLNFHLSFICYNSQNVYTWHMLHFPLKPCQDEPLTSRALLGSKNRLGTKYYRIQCIFDDRFYEYIWNIFHLEDKYIGNPFCTQYRCSPLPRAKCLCSFVLEVHIKEMKTTRNALTPRHTPPACKTCCSKFNTCLLRNWTSKGWMAHRKWKETKQHPSCAWLLINFFPFPVGHPPQGPFLSVTP